MSVLNITLESKEFEAKLTGLMTTVDKAADHIESRFRKVAGSVQAQINKLNKQINIKIVYETVGTTPTATVANMQKNIEKTMNETKLAIEKTSKNIKIDAPVTVETKRSKSTASDLQKLQATENAVFKIKEATATKVSDLETKKQKPVVSDLQAVIAAENAVLKVHNTVKTVREKLSKDKANPKYIVETVIGDTSAIISHVDKTMQEVHAGVDKALKRKVLIRPATITPEHKKLTGEALNYQNTLLAAKKIYETYAARVNDFKIMRNKVDELDIPYDDKVIKKRSLYDKFNPIKAEAKDKLQVLMKELNAIAGSEQKLLGGFFERILFGDPAKNMSLDIHRKTPNLKKYAESLKIDQKEFANITSLLSGQKTSGGTGFDIFGLSILNQLPWDIVTNKLKVFTDAVHKYFSKVPTTIPPITDIISQSFKIPTPSMTAQSPKLIKNIEDAIAASQVKIPTKKPSITKQEGYNEIVEYSKLYLDTLKKIDALKIKPLGDTIDDYKQRHIELSRLKDR